jgi:signal transduction histidine kinase
VRAGVILEVSDDGVGLSMPSGLSSLHIAGHFGIIGMTERAGTIGGGVRVSIAPAHGTTITVRSALFEGAQPGQSSSGQTYAQLTTATGATP